MKNVITNNGKNVCSTNKYSLFILNIEYHDILNYIAAKLAIYSYCRKFSTHNAPQLAL